MKISIENSIKLLRHEIEFRELAGRADCEKFVDKTTANWTKLSIIQKKFIIDIWKLIHKRCSYCCMHVSIFPIINKSLVSLYSNWRLLDKKRVKAESSSRRNLCFVFFTYLARCKAKNQRFRRKSKIEQTVLNKLRTALVSDSCNYFAVEMCIEGKWTAKLFAQSDEDVVSERRKKVHAKPENNSTLRRCGRFEEVKKYKQKKTQLNGA